MKRTMFKRGQYYIFNSAYYGVRRPCIFNSMGAMDFVLDGKPHLCTKTYPESPNRASFDGDMCTWLWGNTMIPVNCMHNNKIGDTILAMKEGLS